jgi:GntR family transcriptional regulator
MNIPARLQVDAHSPIPIRRQLAEQLKHVIEGGGVPRDQALPSIRELAGFLGINPNTVARVIEDLRRSGYVEARRGRGVFVAGTLPPSLSPHLREAFLQDVVIRGAALGMTTDDLAVGVLSLVGERPAAVKGEIEILLVECTPSELEFFARELEAHLPVHVHKVRLADLATVVGRKMPSRHWGAAVTSFFHLPEVERLVGDLRIPVIALLAEVHLKTLHRLAQFPPKTRVGVASAEPETAHNLEHSIARAGLPNIVLVGGVRAERAALGALARRVDAIVCSTPVAARVKRFVGSAAEVIIDDRALDTRAIEMLAAVLVRRNGNGDGTPATPHSAERPPPPGRQARGSARRRSGLGAGRGRDAGRGHPAADGKEEGS